jgi:hypothetical protein
MGVVVVSTSLTTAGDVGVVVMMVGSWAVAKGTAAMNPTAAMANRVRVRKMRDNVFMEIDR